MAYLFYTQWVFFRVVNSFIFNSSCFSVPHLSFSQFNHSVVSDSLWPHGLQHARVPCPSPTPRACSNSCPSSWWCHPTIYIQSSNNPTILAATAAKSLQSCSTLCDPIDGSPPVPSLGLSRQEYWSGLPFPSPKHESEKWKWNLSVVSDS